MALRDQPYLPLYVQDFLTDEKLNMCTPATQGVYIKILCITRNAKNVYRLSLSDKYSNLDDKLAISSFLSKQIYFPYSIIESSVKELLEISLIKRENNILIIEKRNFLKIRLRDTDYKKWLSLISEVFERDNYTCQYCGDYGGKLEADHKIPFSKGGDDSLENLITACRRCNRRKSNKSVDEFKSLNL
jgi:hypothetical protein